MKKWFFSVLLSSLTFSSQVTAWGQTGHRITGSIAEQYLSEQANTQIMKLLPNESLAEASTYADEMRSNPSEFWQNQAGPYHYVTVPQGKTYSQIGAPQQGDAVSALKLFSTMVKDKVAPLAQRQRALRFIVHIIGDLHQPLHAGNGEDKGGNDRKVTFMWESSNLHRVWDSGLIDSRQLSYTEWTQFLGNKISAEQAIEWQVVDPLVWIEESTEIRDTIYPNADEESLSWNYLYDNLPIAKKRLQQAGVRIAAYLNVLFEKQEK